MRATRSSAISTTSARARTAAAGSTPIRIRSIDRYAEQLWDTLFAKAPEIDAVQLDARWRMPKPAPAGERPLGEAAAPASTGTDPPRTGMATTGRLGERGRARRCISPTRCSASSAIPSASRAIARRTASGEDFLHNYHRQSRHPDRALSPTFPADAQTVLLTQAAAADPQIIARIERACTRAAE